MKPLSYHDVRAPDGTDRSGPRVHASIEASADLPTSRGAFRFFVFSNTRDTKEHVAMVRGDVAGQEDILTRVHSECMTGDVMGSLRCDCQAQLERALTLVGKEPRGLVIYLRQEGRGIGLTNKIRAYGLQERGLDTMAANRALGFAEDEREYDVAAAILEALGVRSIALLTNNPDKVTKLERQGVTIARRIPHTIPSNVHNRAYLKAKATLGGHWLEEPDEGGDGPSPR